MVRIESVDYLLDGPVLLGSQRIGPDLTTIGARMPDATLQLQHLYKPRLKVPRSAMPRYGYLFEKHKLAEGRKPSPSALPADTEPGYEIIPKPEAHALVAYLLSLQALPPLFEAPVPGAPKPSGAAAPATNAAAAPAPAVAPTTASPVAK